MSTEFAWFKAENTGEVVKYPARFEGRPGLIRVDSEPECTDCFHVEDEEQETIPVVTEDAEVTYDEYGYDSDLGYGGNYETTDKDN